MRLGIPIVDHLTGYVAMSGILMALYARERTGMGQRVEATLFDAGLSLLVPHAANWFHSGRAPRLLGSAHPNICPYDKFSAGDGEIFLGGRQRRPVPEALRAHRPAGRRGRPALRDQREPAREPRRHCRQSSRKRLPSTKSSRSAGT